MEFLALTGVLIAQPMFDVLRKNAGLFILWHLNGLQLIAFAAAIVVLPAVALVLVEAVAAFVMPSARFLVHTAFVALLVFGIAVVVVKEESELGPTAIALVALVPAVALIAAFIGFGWVRMWLRYLAVAPVVFGLLFVATSPATDVSFGVRTPVANVEVRNPVRVVMIVFDELPLTSMLDGHGNIDKQLFPNFAALSGEATWYRNDTTVAPFTGAAVPAILTGRYPVDQHHLPFVSDYPHNLFTLLGNRYEMNVHETITRLCPTELCPRPRKLVTGAHPGLVGALHDTYSIWRDFSSLHRTKLFSISAEGAIDLHPLDTGARFVDSITPTSKPRLDFLHLMVPHSPWHLLPSGQDYATATNAAGDYPSDIGLVKQRWSDAWSAEAAYQRHLLQLQSGDALLGRVLQRLHAIGAFDNSMIVVTADHGAAFAAGEPFRGVAESNYPNIMWTPLLMKMPAQRSGAIDDRPARSIDILPTIADELQTHVPWPVDGRSLLSAVRPDEPRRLLEWDLNALQPPPGEHYLSFDGSRGFKTVLAARAAAPDANADLRLYRIGPFGGLVGKPAAPFVRPGGKPATAEIDARSSYTSVDLKATRAPWAQIRGTIDIAPEGRRLALTVNGTIAGIYETAGSSGRAEFWGLIPPTLLKTGDNTLALYTLDGTPSAPVLRPDILR